MMRLLTLIVGTFLLFSSACTNGANGILHTRDSVIFIGASTVQRWALYTDFTQYSWINKGISGNTCHDVRLRFRTDVIETTSRSVFILCGTNDMHEGYDPLATVKEISAMVDEAHAAGMRVYVGSVSPWGNGPLSDPSPPNYPTRSSDVDLLNHEIEAMLLPKGESFVDFRPALRGTDSHFVPELTDDGIHPNADGYRQMIPIAVRILNERP